MLLEQHIEELRAELRNAVYQDERQLLLNELAAAEVQRAEEEAAYDAMVSSEPPL